MTTKFALISCCSILFAAWTFEGDYMTMAQIISPTSFSIMPGQSVEKTFRVGHSSDPISLIVRTDSDSTQLALLISQAGNDSKAHTKEPLVNTSFMGEFAFSFIPEADSPYKLIFTNYGAELVKADIDVLYLVPVGDKLDDTGTQNIQTMMFLVVIFGSIILTATIMKYGIMGKYKHSVKPRRDQS